MDKKARRAVTRATHPHISLTTEDLVVFNQSSIRKLRNAAQGRLPIRGLFLGARGARALPERPATQGAATGLCLFQSAARISPAVCDAGSIAKSSWFVVGDSWLVRVPLS